LETRSVALRQISPQSARGGCDEFSLEVCGPCCKDAECAPALGIKSMR
jgi:hypothetical protein